MVPLSGVRCSARRVYIVGALSPSHFHLGHIGLLPQPVYQAPELLGDGAEKPDSTHLAWRVRDSIVASLREESAA